ncbi:hypothetical protein FOC4_g10014787 [Fusarium odoratissimum]|uniref:Uncharacterized protein n=2 Tax=Fusarium oxysporum species complex TaxID=171631 RepID=N1R777_FUSC4|nr:hypothetical protein FOC4_g10014787 [Fusarium odoratissimum]
MRNSENPRSREERRRRSRKKEVQNEQQNGGRLMVIAKVEVAVVVLVVDKAQARRGRGAIYARLRRGLQEGETARGTVGGSLAFDAAGSCVRCGLALVRVCVGRIGGIKASAKQAATMNERSNELLLTREMIDAEEELEERKKISRRKVTGT